MRNRSLPTSPLRW